MNLGRHLKIDAESALRRANAKYRGRFAAMELAAGDGAAFEAMPLDEKEELWLRAKSAEASGGR